MKAVQEKILTYEDYLATPETKQRYEIIDGEWIWMSPAPTPDHQRRIRDLVLKLDPWIRKQDLGELLFAPVDIVISRRPLRTRQPDLLFIRKDRLNIIQERIEGAPDLVIEILSPGNTRAQVLEKLADYARIGVPECWMFSSEAQTLEVLILIKGKYKRRGLFGSGDKIKSRVWPQLNRTVDELFSLSEGRMKPV